MVQNNRSQNSLVWLSGLAEDVCEPGVANNTTCCWISFGISWEAFDQQAWFLGGHLRLKLAQIEFIIPLSLPNWLLPLHLSQWRVVIVQTRHLRTIPWLSLYSLYFFIHQIPSVLLNFSGPFAFLWSSCYFSGPATSIFPGEGNSRLTGFPDSIIALL